MRKKIYAMAQAHGIELLRRAPVVHLATTRPDGAPVLKPVHGVVVDDQLYWHGSRGGEKAACVGRPSVVSAHETVAEVPSYWVDPELACPATTYYRSVQAHGIAEPVTDPTEAAAALQALMNRYQPEGGFEPISNDHPAYREELRRVLMVRMPLANLTAKGKLGQNRSPDEMRNILRELWVRGTARDLRAIETLLAVHPARARPTRFLGPEGTALVPVVRAAQDLDDAVEILMPMYWNSGRFSREDVRQTLAASAACVGARCPTTGRLIATARAVSDRSKRAWIYDVGVREDWRGKRVGTAIMQLLLDHPAVRAVGEVHLGTRDAQSFYARLGFEARPVHMVWERR